MGEDLQGDRGYEEGKLKFEVAADSTLVEAKKGEGIGVDGFRKKKGTKVHALVTRVALPFALETSSGNEQRFKSFKSFIENLRLKKGGKGRPKERPVEISADGAYDSLVMRSYLRKRGIRANIPVNERRRKKELVNLSGLMRGIISL